MHGPTPVAASMLFPPLLPTLQAPTPMMVTGRPELAVPVSGTPLAPYVGSSGCVKVIICEAFVMSRLAPVKLSA